MAVAYHCKLLPVATKFETVAPLQNDWLDANGGDIHTLTLAIKLRFIPA